MRNEYDAHKQLKATKYHRQVVSAHGQAAARYIKLRTWFIPKSIALWLSGLTK